MQQTHLILSASKSKQSKTILLRNLTGHHLAAKFVVDNKEAFSLPNKGNYLLNPRNYGDISLAVDASKLDKKQLAEFTMKVYVRNITATNLPSVRRWLLESGTEMRSQLVFNMKVVFTDEEFSAPKIVLDVSEAQFHVEKTLKAATDDVATSKDIAEDVDTAQEYSRSDIVLPLKNKSSAVEMKPLQRKTPAADATGTLNCALFQSFMDTVFPPVGKIQA